MVFDKKSSSLSRAMLATALLFLGKLGNPKITSLKKILFNRKFHFSISSNQLLKDIQI
jgi:hypothetical protein